MSGYGTSTSALGGLAVAYGVGTYDRTRYHHVVPCSAFVSRYSGFSIPSGGSVSHAAAFDPRRSRTYTIAGTAVHVSAIPSARGSAASPVGGAGTGCGCQVRKLESADGVPSLRRERTAYQSVGGDVPAFTSGIFSR